MSSCFMLSSCFMSSCFMVSSCFMLSWLGAAPDWAKAARDTARKHIAINLLIIFLMDSPRFSVLQFDLARTAAQRRCAYRNKVTSPPTGLLHRNTRNFFLSKHSTIKTRPEIDWPGPVGGCDV